MSKMKILLSSPLIKINSCLIGYGLWLMLSQFQMLTTKVEVPVCFYHTTKGHTIFAPESVEAVLSGPRSILRQINNDSSGIHLDASTLQIGKNTIFLTKDNLFLPDKINLVSLIPSRIKIKVKKEV